MLIKFIEPCGPRYEDNYGQYLEFFKKIATTPGDQIILVEDVPWSWVPLLLWLRCTIVRPVCRFRHCGHVRRMLRVSQSASSGVVNMMDVDRTMVEVLCGFRPELVDALWKIDMQWAVPPMRVKMHPREKEFIVTTNGSFHREEVKTYIQTLDNYKPTSGRVLLVPCAADKPYPSPLHMACIERLPKDFYIAIATGVLGIVPQELWLTMPFYDSGIPNQWRLFETTKQYFEQHTHDEIIVYCDFYAHVLKEAFRAVGCLGRVRFVIPPYKYDDYVDLMSEENLARLSAALEKVNA